MKLKLFLMTAATMALVSSCSSDEVVQSNESANAIKFSVVANNGSRAADYFCNTAKPADFHVWAAVGVTYDGEGNVTAGQSYFADETFKKGSGTGADPNSLVYTIKGDYRYWPAEGTPVSFWAAKNYTSFEWETKVGAPTMTLTVDPSASKQHDLLYGYTKATRPATGNSVPMNLRHALSQIVFQAKNENSNIDVEINKVDVVNIINSGTYSLPTGDDMTNTNFDDHKQGTNDATTGTWSTLGTTKKTFTTEEFTKVSVHGPSEEDGTTTKGGQSILVNLTNDRFTSTDDHVTGGDDVTSTNYLKNSLLLIPQPIAKTAGAIKKDDTTTPYFLVYCKIRNVEAGNGTAVDNETHNDVYLWGGASEYKAIAVPITLAEDGTSWAEGKKYVYTFVFSKNGHGGYDPATGNDVLIPIELAVTVDDFSIAEQKDVDTDKGIQ